MGNAFMPSVMTSLNQAGGMTLQAILEQRALQQELAQQQAKLDQSSMGDMLGFGMRMRADQRAQANDAESTRRFNATQSRLTEKDAFERRQKQNERGVASMAAQMPENTPHLMRRQMAIEAGVTPTAFDAPKTERTLADKVAETTALTEARERTKARFDKPKATKVAKDNPKAPAGLVAAIQGRQGTTGFATADEAMRSIQNRWQDWRKNYPGIDVNAVRTAVQNLYGQRVTSGAADAMSEIIAKAVAEGLAGDTTP